MSKSIKILSIVLIIFSLIINFYGVVQASDINMNLTSNEVEDDTNEISDDNTSDIQSPSDLDSITPPSSVGAVAEEGLGLSNILSILLITVGVILILLAIAIIIRLK